MIEKTIQNHTRFGFFLDNEALGFYIILEEKKMRCGRGEEWDEGIRKGERTTITSTERDRQNSRITFTSFEKFKSFS